MDDQDEIDAWEGEDKGATSNMLAAFWSSHDITSNLRNQAQMVTDLQIRLNWWAWFLWECWWKHVTMMARLTTKCVYEWRLRKKPAADGKTEKCWLRKLRLVAKVYACVENRVDTYSLASSTHILNLFPLLYLQKANGYDPDSKAETRSSTLACLDVRDAFVMVP